LHDGALILTLTGGLSAALVHHAAAESIADRRVSARRMLVGPHTPGFVADATIAEQLAQIDVILLMFGVGLQFHSESIGFGDELMWIRGLSDDGRAQRRREHVPTRPTR
jgi:CPA2 family monovalent cation:H+ antiporter-2